MRILMAILIASAIFIGAGLGEDATTGDVNAFKEALEQDGFTVQEGRIGFLDLIKLCDQGLLPAAYGNNPSTRYLTYFIPPAPGLEVPELFSRVSRALGMSQDTSAFWTLGPDEAIVFVGRTPPECRYYSFDHYLLSRTYGNETRWIFAPLADTINNLVINTEGTPDGAVADPFNQTAVIVATADRAIDQRIRAAALSAGYSGEIFNTQVFPSSMLKMGLEESSDKFIMVIRPALYKDKQAGEDYLNNPPATVFRVTLKGAAELDPYDYPALRVRGTGTTEFDLLDDLEELRVAILNKYSGSNATELPTSVAVQPGTDAIQRGINAMAPDNDACYLWSAVQTVSSPTPPFPDLSLYYDFLRDPAITLGNGANEFIIVYGVNHVATGKATYSNVALYGADLFNGVKAIADEDFNGTAEEYLPDNPYARYLYVYKFARDCSDDPYCYEVPYGIGAYGIDLDQPLFVAWRSYLEESTKTGPSYTEIVYDRAIKFD
ncbi:MAG: conserved exported protein of unknown function [Methanothrix sp.]|jgi:hypothetical protein|nr:MAG: conserved exported protein of unknown function [Methanothrix sp.]